MLSLSAILKDNTYKPADIPELESKLFFEGDRSRRGVRACRRLPQQLADRW